MTIDASHPTMTAGELVERLSQCPPDMPVTIASPDGWWLNIAGVTDPDETDEPSLIIEAIDTFSTRQW